jgi:glycosyltransferase involved in cell wall biosynthesis
MPKVTICIPAYNAGNYIGEALDSLLAQTYRDIEIIVSDNYSTDNTREVVESFQNQGVQLVTCPLPPIKTGSPLDNCRSCIQNWDSLLERGSGEYVGIYHADDVFEPDIVQKQVLFLNRHLDCSGVFVLARHMSDLGKLLQDNQELPFLEREQKFNQLELISSILHHRHYFSSSGPLLRRECWSKAGRLDAETFELACDTEFWIRLAGIGPIGVLNERLVRYRLNPGQGSAAGQKIYHYRRWPSLLVLEAYLEKTEIKSKITVNDYAHFAVKQAVDNLRIALNFMKDDLRTEAKSILSSLPRVNLNQARVIWVEHRYCEMARWLAAYGLWVACQCGIGKYTAACIESIERVCHYIRRI